MPLAAFGPRLLAAPVVNLTNKKTTVGGKDGYGVAVVQAKYENAAVTFTLSYTPEGKLGGLFFK